MTDPVDQEVMLALCAAVMARLDDAAGLSASCQAAKMARTRRRALIDQLVREIHAITVLFEAVATFAAPRINL